MDVMIGTFTGVVSGMARKSTIGQIKIEGDFPKSHPGEYPAARAHISDFTYKPANGDQVSFELWRVNGDLIARAIVKR